MIKNKQTFSIRETAEILVPDKFGRTSYLIALSLVVLMIGLITLLLKRLPNVVPLYFTKPWGEGRLTERIMLYLLPTTSMLFLFINLILGRLSAKLSALLPRVLAVSTAVIAFMMMIALLGIVQSLVL
jgi:hypothetical protein